MRAKGYDTGICPICGAKTVGHRKYCSPECRMVGMKLRALDEGMDVDVPDLKVSPCNTCTKQDCTNHCTRWEKYFAPLWNDTVRNLRKKLGVRWRGE